MTNNSLLLRKAPRCGCWVVLLSCFFVARGPRNVVADTTNDPPLVTIRSVDADQWVGRLIHFSSDGGVKLRTDSGSDNDIPIRNLLRLSPVSTKSARRNSDFTLTLSNGDTFLAKNATIVKESVTLETADIGAMTLPLELVSELTTAQSTVNSHQSSLVWFRGSQPPAEDSILLTNGDTARGFITSLDNDSLAWQSESGQLSVPLRLVVAIRFSSPRQPKTPTPSCIVTLHSGGRMTLANISWVGNDVQGQFLWGTQVRFEAERIARVDVHGGRWQWLADLEPTSFVQTPQLTLNWPLRKNRNVLNGPLTVAGELYEQGLGVHGRTVVSYELGGAYRQFVTSFGLDDDSGPWADVSVRIVVDGRTRFDQADVRCGRLFGPIRVDVAKAKLLELIVDFGRNGDMQDRFNWIEPALVRE